MKINSTKKYWVGLKSHTYTSFNPEDRGMLLYNTLTGEYIETDNKKSIALINTILDRSNLGVICIEGELLSEAELFSFVDGICRKELGDITEITSINRKPIRLVPLLNLQKDMDKLGKYGRSQGEDIVNYLTGLNLYINTQCSQPCVYCSSYFKQVSSCVKSDAMLEMPIKEIKKIIKQIEFAPINTIQILGGNILGYSKLNELINLLLTSSLKTHYWLHYLNIHDCNKELLANLNYKEIIVNFPININIFQNVLENVDIQTTLHFIIENMKQYEQVEGLLRQHEKIEYQIEPFFNGNNYHFFKENIFLSNEDIFTTTHSFRQIFARQKLNTNFFGSLTVLANGDVYANVNSDKLGNTESDSMLNLINKEMTANTAWRQIRDKAPCTDCNYQYLCPSPSNYETAIGKANLCHVQ